MSEVHSDWIVPLQVAALFALDPAGFGGIALRAPPGAARDAWIESLRGLVPQLPWRRMPAQIAEGRLLGGLDLAASLRAARPVVERGLLAESDGGIVLLAMAERMPAATVAHLTAALDTGLIIAERDGLSLRQSARIGVVAFDEGITEEEHVALSLVDRMAFQLDLHGIRAPQWSPSEEPAVTLPVLFDQDELTQARARLVQVRMDPAFTGALASTALALGVLSLRPTLFAIRAARALAALESEPAVLQEHVEAAARLVLAPRATRLPPAESAAEPAQQNASEPPPDIEPNPAQEPGHNPAASGGNGSTDNETSEHDESAAREPDAANDILLSATAAAIPSGLLDRLKSADPGRARGTVGRAGTLSKTLLRGRPAGVRPGRPGSGARLSLVETLRAAAPWQQLRRTAATDVTRRIEIRSQDFRVQHYTQRSQTTTIFAIDASGSSALHRLAEAKGAVELLLADCYVRRDRVAVLSFRGRIAELLLPPTRSLVRAKRALAALPGGGGTPLSAGLDAAFVLADGIRQRGETPSIVVLTDGRANVSRDGAPGRDRAATEAMIAARRIRGAGFRSLLLDTSPRAQAPAEELAREMGAHYLILPYANARILSEAVRDAFVTGPVP